MSTITPLPVAPSRARPTTYSVEGDAFLGALPAFGAELNSIVGTVEAYAAAASSDADGARLAAATANFKGVWADLTGSMNIPASVYHAGLYWMLTENTADVTAITPGVSPIWLEIVFDTSSTGGTKSWNVAVNTELTFERVHMVTTTVSNLVISLPATLSSDQGYLLTVIKNTGSEVFFLKNNPGAYITRIQPGETFLVSLTDYAAQTYAVERLQFNSPGITVGNSSVVASVNPGGSLAIAPLDSTRLVASWLSTSTITLYSAVITVTELGVSIGTPYGITAASQMYYVDVKKLDTDKLILSYKLVGDTYLKSVILTATGTSLTGGSIASLSQAVSTYVYQVVLSPTRVLIAMNATSSIVAVVASISGTTVTYGTVLTSVGGVSVNSSYKSGFHYLTPTTVLAVLSYADINNHFVISIADTTITYGVNVAAGNSERFSSVALSPTKAIVVSAYSPTPFHAYYNIITISGTTVTTSGKKPLITGYNTALYVEVSPIDSEHVLLDTYYGSYAPLLGNAHKYSILTVKGNFITEVNSSPDVYGNYNVFSNTMFAAGAYVSLFQDTDNSQYLSAIVIKLGVA